MSAAVIPGSTKRSYVGPLNLVLRPGPPNGLKALDIFCGAGGLSLGFRARGFETVGYDSEEIAVKTYKRNIGPAVARKLAEDSELPEADVILAGPPCQPWSRAGSRLGESDGREGFLITASIIQRCQPRAVVIENVPDMARRGSRAYLDSFKRLLTDAKYRVFEEELNAADYGVPQNRRRLFIIAIRSGAFVRPDQMPHKVLARRAIGRTARTSLDGVTWLTPSMEEYIRRYEKASKCKYPRDLHLDRPSRTLTVRNLIGATGDMLRVRTEDGRRRTLAAREAARLQSFPDWFTFEGSFRRQLEQIGNAVPPLLSYHVAGALLEALSS